MLPGKPLSPQAKNLFDRIRPKIVDELKIVQEIPVSVLIWGPTPSAKNDVGKLRNNLRNELREKGHLAMFSEEIIEPDSGSTRIQQLIHAQEFDLIVSLPFTPGSIGELHDFAGDRRVNSKLLVCLNNEFKSGYSNDSIESLCSVLTYEVLFYNGMSELPVVKESVFNHVQRIREVKYFYQGRI